MKSNLEYFTPWMMEDEFYNLENGVQTFLIPKTGDYRLTLTGFSATIFCQGIPSTHKCAQSR